MTYRIPFCLTVITRHNIPHPTDTSPTFRYVHFAYSPKHKHMSILKKAIKILSSLLLGGIIGMTISTAAIVLFTDTTIQEFIGKLTRIDITDAIVSASVGVLCFIVSIPILILLHEAGHLVCGLLTGYRFVSFRIFNITFIKHNNRIRIKRFSVAGTGGQCLLTPPDMSETKMPTMLYNAGGIIANLLALFAVLPALWLPSHPFVKEFAVIFIITDIFIILTNAIPMKINGIGNDGHNILALHNNTKGKRALALQLRLNALLQEGVRPKDMPKELFGEDNDTDYSNPMEVAIPIANASRLVDEMKWHEALSAFEELYSHKSEIIKLYADEIACELVFLSLITGNTEKAIQLYSDELKKYISAYRKVMSSKERILCAIALFMDHDEPKARDIYDNLVKCKEAYLLQGEVKSDLAIMEKMLGIRTSGNEKTETT